MRKEFLKISTINNGRRMMRMTERVGASIPEETVRGRPYAYPIPARTIPHLGHGRHLCHLVEDIGIGIEEYKKLIKNPKFLCKKCGRVAAREENLCEPIKL
jgi:hypothetical protein